MSEPFRPPLILDAASRPRVARWRDGLFTLLLWAGWSYLLLAAVGSLWVPPFVQWLLPVEAPEHPWAVIRVALVNLAVAGIVCSVMLLRVVLERRRFAGEDRRLGFPRPSDDEIASALQADCRMLPVWRAARRLVVHHDDAGRVLRVETTV